MFGHELFSRVHIFSSFTCTLLMAFDFIQIRLYLICHFLQSFTTFVIAVFILVLDFVHHGTPNLSPRFLRTKTVCKQLLFLKVVQVLPNSSIFRSGGKLFIESFDFLDHLKRTRNGNQVRFVFFAIENSEVEIACLSFSFDICLGIL